MNQSRRLLGFFALHTLDSITFEKRNNYAVLDLRGYFDGWSVSGSAIGEERL
jgi:hypothetical protein